MFNHLPGGEIHLANRAPVSRHLPFDARTLLVRASQTPVPHGDPLARVRAVEAASEKIRYQFPRFFHSESKA